MPDTAVTTDKKGYIIAVILFLMLIGMGGCWIYDHMQLIAQAKAIVVNSTGKDIILKQYKDDLNRNHTESQAREVAIVELKYSQDSGMKAIRAEIGNLKNLVSRTVVYTTTSGGVTTIMHDTTIRTIHDTVGRKEQAFIYHDKWMLASGTVVKDTLQFKYSLLNETTIDYKWKRPRWDKPKELYLETTSQNPSTTVNKVQTYVIQSPIKKFWETQWFSAGIGFVGGLYSGIRLITR